MFTLPIHRIVPILNVLLCVSLTSYSQNFTKLDKQLKQWYSGTIVFTSGETINTKFAYNPLAEEGLIQIETNEGMLSFGPSHVSSFNFIDIDSGQERRFESMPLYNKYTASQRKYFMEILFENKLISILGKKSLIGYGNGYSTKLVNSYDRYFIDMRNGELSLVDKKNLFLILGENSAKARAFARKNKLKFKTTRDYSIVIDYISHLN